MTHQELDAVLAGVVRALRDHVTTTLAPVLDRLAAVEARAAIPGRDGRDGLPGVAGAPGVDGVNGRDGVDGLGFDDQTATYDGQRTVTLTWTKGERTVTQDLVLPIPIDRGVYRPEVVYTRGDVVTRGGSLWICQSETTAAPGETVDAWRLSVKRGGEGKPGPKGERGERGERGEPGVRGPAAWGSS